MESAAARVYLTVDNLETTGYTSTMFEIIRSATFDRWFSGLRDVRAVAKIATRINRLEQGNPGDVKPVGEGVSELRIDYGPGYRVYYMQRGPVLVILLCGGDKGSQDADIAKAKRIAADWKE